MNKDEKRYSELRLKNFYLQIHLTVIYEDDFLKTLTGYGALRNYRDDILDKINQERRFLGHIK
jgi:hypothetical protein